MFWETERGAVGAMNDFVDTKCRSQINQSLKQNYFGFGFYVRKSENLPCRRWRQTNWGHQNFPKRFFPIRPNLIFLFTFTLISLKSLEDKSLFSLAFLISLFISVKQFTLISATNLEKRKILQKSLHVSHVSLSIVCPAAILLSLYVREKFEASDQNIVIYEQYTLSTISESNRFFVFIIF